MIVKSLNEGESKGINDFFCVIGGNFWVVFVVIRIYGGLLVFLVDYLDLIIFIFL